MAAVILWSVVGCTHLIKKQARKRAYKYSSLNPGRRETRVLTLAPGGHLDELKGDIQTVRLDGDPSTPPPRYEAVSYARGSGSLKPDVIRIGSTGRRLLLPYHLGVTLRHLRSKELARTLWVDVISINQDDPKEKAWQVAMMPDIYRSAERVVVWLGPAANESNNAMSLLDDLGSMVEFDFVNNRMRPSPAGAVDPAWADPVEYLPYDQEELWSIYELVHRAWFGRVWVRQEIAVADPARTLVVCGNKRTSWDLLRTALACIANKPRHYLDRSEEGTPELRFTRRYELVLLLCQQEREVSLPDLLDQGRKFNCADPRDRVFAVMNMASDVDESFGLVPDYTMPKSQVYENVVLRYINHAKNTNILASCEMSAARPTMPTWVPDWSTKRIANTMPMHLASSMSDASVHNFPSSVLKTGAVRCATVKSAQVLFGDFVPVTDVVDAIRRCAPPDVLDAPYRGGEPGGMLGAYCATLAWGLFDSLYNPPIEAYPDVDVSLESLRLVLETRNDTESDGSKNARPSVSYDFATLTYITHLLGTCKGRSFFTTEEGYVGLGPRETRPGDKVHVLLGCDVPLVLRPRLDARFQIVGESYVHGLMTGEALLGPLPEGVRMVMDSTDPEEPVQAVFLRTQKLQAEQGQGEGQSEGHEEVQLRLAEDPRLDALRDKISATRGEKAPRVDENEDVLVPENLKAAGVDLVTVDLG